MTDDIKAADAAAPNAVETSGGSAIPPEELGRISDDIISALKTVYDPEIPADIYELGLIYKVDISIVWEPAWTPDRMSDEARLVLNMW